MKKLVSRLHISNTTPSPLLFLLYNTMSQLNQIQIEQTI